jgi:nucleoside-diphosphate-sugar epimerase
LAEQGLEPVLWDVMTGGDPLPSVDTVLWAVGYDRSQPYSQHEVYVEGLRRTLEAMPQPRRFVYVSSTGVFGDHGGEWVDESTEPAPIDEGGKACLEGEAVVGSFARRGWNVVILRLAGLYGPGRMIGVERLRQGLPIAADPEGWLNLIHVEDAAVVVDAARRADRCSDLYLVSDGVPVRRVDFYSHAANLVGAPLPSFDVSTRSRHRGNRRVCPDRLKSELVSTMRFPSYIEGLRDSVDSRDGFRPIVY